MQLDDKFTRRARPTVVYGGLALAPLNYTVIPFVSNLMGMDISALNIPSEFWYSWGAVASVYAAGRSAEKKGVQSNLLAKVMGGARPDEQEDQNVYK